jgi:hypothetical protein
VKDLLRMVNCGQDMGGTDSAWYAKQRGEDPKYVYQGMKKRLTEDKVALAKYWRKQGHTWPWISRRLGCHESTCRRNCT